MLKQALADRHGHTTANGVGDDDEHNVESSLEWEQRMHEQADWELGAGLKNFSGHCRSALSKKILPQFATSKTYKEYLQGRTEHRRRRER